MIRLQLSIFLFLFSIKAIAMSREVSIETLAAIKAKPSLCMLLKLNMLKYVSEKMTDECFITSIKKSINNSITIQDVKKIGSDWESGIFNDLEKAKKMEELLTNCFKENGITNFD